MSAILQANRVNVVTTIYNTCAPTVGEKTDYHSNSKLSTDDSENKMQFRPSKCPLGKKDTVMLSIIANQLIGGTIALGYFLL